MKKLCLLILSISLFFACSEDMVTYQDQLEKDIKKIEKYLSDSGLVAQSTKSGLHYIIEQEGSGDEYPTLYSFPKVKYTGRFLDGKIFDSGTANDLPLYKYTKGWQEGIPLFKKGGKGKLFVPSGLGYGSTPFFDIPANSVLIFDVELIEIFPAD